jgi:hypothetical protein
MEEAQESRTPEQLKAGEVMSAEGAAWHQVRIRPSTLIPYLVVGLAWFAFLMVAFRVRMIEPVFLWVFAHGLILDNLHILGFWAPRLITFGAYMAAALLAWFLFELGGRKPEHVWRRAVIAWVCIQVIFCLIAAFLTSTGVVHE